MVGPGLSKRNEQAETIRWEDATSRRESSIEFMSGLQADYNLLHAHPQSMQLLQWAHVFVLFNPGSGSPSLSARWDPTLRLLLETRKPVLCTAHGPHDLQRDIAALEAIAEQEDGEVRRTLPTTLSSFLFLSFPFSFISCLLLVVRTTQGQQLGDGLLMLLPPHDNPFASLRQTIDDKEDPRSQVVTANHSIYAFCGK